MRILHTAYEHGISDEDMEHAVRQAMAEHSMPDGMTMLLGPDRAGRFLEVGVLDIDEDDPLIIHAMPMRPKFQRFLHGRW